MIGHFRPAGPQMEREAGTAEAQLGRARQLETSAESRFGMLETIQEYGAERLVSADEERVVRQAHAASFLALAKEADPHHYVPHLPGVTGCSTNVDDQREATSSNDNHRSGNRSFG